MELGTTNSIRAYLRDREATRPDESGRPGPDLAGLAGDFAQTLHTSEAEAMGAMTGSADPHALVQALAQTELAVETAVTIRNRVVEAYQEILRMPV
ncbi:flagellar hook-basal body complex protein FliE [Wenxinia saemankumensis]|uniref:Flagellar hook-basal body complex protein FliE n=1 Tax=Wenxinia saemankumensis TaxID=1447782 RepID=A0A1M6G5T4_9RHOB|nr:flagellar hook-basal body complex protein FliE [Wenxinia saemankumensis]SHJ05356.1 flagellar hook-basal body complex protein FliE [Wenxinia saemankumensis]